MTVVKRINDNELSGVKEIARRAKVSIATVDRVIHNRAGVSLKTKEKIEAIIKEMNYKPNILARRLASKKIFHFAVLIPKESPETEYWGAPLKGIKNGIEEVQVYGIEVSFYLYDLNDRQTFIKKANSILEGRYEGVIVAPSFMTEALDFFYKCESKKIKTVFINSDINHVHPLCYVGPDLFQSGKLAGNLSSYLIPPMGNILVLNISKELDAEHHLLKKVAGFKSFFDDSSTSVNVEMLSIHETDYYSVSQELETFLYNKDIDLIFVTNSRVFTVAKYLEEKKINDIKLIGYDYLSQNLIYLEKGIIDFLICQKPIEQGYQGVISLYNFFVNQSQVKDIQLMPIDILTKENYKYYKN